MAATERPYQKNRRCKNAMVSNLLTIRRMASLLGVAEEDVSLALMIPPIVRPTSRADGIRVFDREAFDIVRYRLEELALDAGDEELDRE